MAVDRESTVNRSVNGQLTVRRQSVKESAKRSRTWFFATSDLTFIYLVRIKTTNVGAYTSGNR